MNINKRCNKLLDRYSWEIEIEKRYNKLVGGLYKKTCKRSIIFLQRVSVLSMLIGMEITRNFDPLDFQDLAVLLASIRGDSVSLGIKP